VSASRTILVIDDSALIRVVVQVGLGGAPGWQVCAAESGDEGIEVAACEQPDAILLDVEMPDLDGPATLERLHAQDATREIPVLFLTGHSGEESRRKLVALGATGVIAKPFDPAGLAAEIVRLLRWAP
jgi:CheY-like chemotaxis protein